jgi:hypothetical protein
MAQETINIGTSPNDGTGDSLRAAGQKINNNFSQLFNVSPISDTYARERANAAFAAANTKVSKSGDTMTGALNFNANTSIGNIQSANGIDLHSEGQNGYSQLNWANTNVVYADSTGTEMYTENAFVAIDGSSNSIVISSENFSWTFSSNGRLQIRNQSTGFVTSLSPTFRNFRTTTTVVANTFTSGNTEEILVCDPSVIGSNVVVNLSANVDNGKLYTIKLVSPGGYSVNVSGTERAYPYIEDPVTGQFETRVIMANTGQAYTWVFNGGVYRYIG